MAQIDFWEDNAGQLYLHDVTNGWVYGGFEQTGTNLIEDVAVLLFAPDLSDDWNVEVIEEREAFAVFNHPETKRILTIHSLHDHPGKAARLYMGLGEGEG